MAALECVPNASEGRDPVVVDALARACGPSLLDVHADGDHHRAVFTLAGRSDSLAEAVQELARSCVERIDLRAHAGEHPRLGALDVVPFVGLDSGDRTVARELAHEFARWAGTELNLPAFLYGGADPSQRSLPEVRRGAFSEHAPDFGPAVPHPTAGAVAVGERSVLVAVNCDLTVDNLALAQEVARAVRERDGGLPGVRALGFELRSQARSQVSMNLVDLSRTGVEAACTTVRDLARAKGGDVAGVELVGLLPAAELERCSAEFLDWSGLSAAQTIEARLAARETAY